MVDLETAVIGLKKYSDGNWLITDDFVLAGPSYTENVLDFTKHFPITGKTFINVQKEKISDVLSEHAICIDFSREKDYHAKQVFLKLKGIDKELSDYLSAPTSKNKLVQMEPNKDIFMPVFKYNLTDVLSDKDYYTLNVSYKISFTTKLYSSSQDEMGSIDVVFTNKNDKRCYYVFCKSVVHEFPEKVFDEYFNGIVLPNFVASVWKTKSEFKDTFRLLNETITSIHSSNLNSVCKVSNSIESETVLDVDYGVPLYISFCGSNTYIFGPFEQNQVDNLKTVLNWLPHFIERNHEVLYHTKQKVYKESGFST